MVQDQNLYGKHLNGVIKVVISFFPDIFPVRGVLHTDDTLYTIKNSPVTVLSKMCQS
jgi:hypothetical protein